MISNQDLTLAFAVAFLILTIPSIGLRMYIRTTIRALGKDDWSMCACQIVFTLFVAVQLVAVKHDIGKHRSLLTNDEAETAMRWWYWMAILYVPATVLLKVSVGLFIMRFVIDQRQRYVIIIMCILTTVFGVAYEFVLAFQCKPVSYWWAAEESPAGKCMPVHYFLNVSYAAATVNMIADWLFAALPAYIVWHTRMTLRVRITISFLLGLCSIAVIATIVRIPFGESYRKAYDKSSDFLWEVTPIVILSTIEVGLGIMASNMATLRPLFDKCLPSKTGTIQQTARLQTINFNEDGSTGKSYKSFFSKSRGTQKSSMTITVTGCEHLDDMPDLVLQNDRLKSSGSDSVETA